MTEQFRKKYRLGEFEVEPETRLLSLDGQPIHLAHKPFQVLLYLIENRDRMVSRNELLDKFWEGHDVYEVALSKCIGAIRKALGDKPDKLRYIETRWAEGYRYIGQFEEKITETGLPLLAFTTTQPLSEKPIDSIAILPFANTSADPEMEYFSEGITESIIGTLSKLSKLRVMAWSTVSRYKNQQIDPREAGQNLGVRAVLAGRMIQLGENLIIKTELVNAADGSHLWSDSCSYKSSNILEVEADICREISEKLLYRLTAEDRKQLTRRYTDNLEAYHAYLKGRYFWNKRTTSWIKKGIEYFQQAINIDPEYALAYAGLADSYTLLVTWEALTPDEGFSKAKAAAQKSLEIDPTLAEAYAGLAHILLHSWEWIDSEHAFKRAVELNPGYAPTHQWYSEYLAAMGRFDEAITEIFKAWELDPLSPVMNADVGWIFYYARRYDEAITKLKQTIEMYPDYWQSHFLIGQAYTQKAMYEEAIAEFHKAMELVGKGALSVLLVGHAYAVSGKKAEALEVIGKLNELSKQRYFSPYRVALIYVGLGDNVQVFEWLERAYEKRDARLIWLKVDPLFGLLRTDSHFQDLMRRVGFQ
jgi:TolB-like protein/Tfp pilus assembly protein PilF